MLDSDKQPLLLDIVLAPPLRRAITAFCLIPALLAGCATDAGRARAEGAGAGAALGALIGGIVGNRDGALVGAALGGVAGLAVGDHVASLKQGYAQREAQLRSTAAEAAQTARAARDYNEQLQQEIAALEESRLRLQSERLAANERRRLTLARQEKAADLLARTNDQLGAVRQQIANQQAAIRAEQQWAEKARQEPAAEGLRLVAAGVSDLEVQERTLDRAQAQLQLIDRRRAY